MTTSIGPHGQPQRDQDQPRSAALVPVPTPAPETEPLPDPRLSDVDEWGRSENLRALARRLYDPIYRSGSGPSGTAWRRSPPTAAPCWWPTTPAPSRPTRRSSCTASRPSWADPCTAWPTSCSRPMPVVGTLWSRLGGVRRPPRQRLPPAPRAAPARPGLPRGHQGHRQALPASATGCAASAGAGSSRSPCGPGCRSCPSRSSAPRSRCRSLWKMPRSPERSASPTSRSRPTCSPSARWAPARLYFPAKFTHAGARPGPLRRASRTSSATRAAGSWTSPSAIRERIQDALYEMLRQRRSVWFG